MEPTNSIADAQTASAAVRDRLLDDLQHTISEAEQWLEDSVSAPSATSSEARARFDDTLRTARSDLRKLEDSLLAHSRNAADSVNLYVQDNPWQAVGIGAALGLLAGVLISRK
ncbi:Membrane-anchored ribosome-binding protein, inhibits growth in stationary phase, ElaB/YqjD/DUF883 family [Duganella sp. CF402]|uniref:DUF883 family protein n=1 Tax=unclassified Duganella TaxID=2636909 RepID=UPI0008D57834|nr:MULTISPECIES: DUF883 family protein [unclassified Duganella]RZT03973.1 ElaB/YqjD/DUF883 family membrane-anchored ribosome-binding protein [Duganella sp. BK701]SEM52868.1 Membrane-anchored ribosome-binding protein, inhibits growth in stationary phase, ElaB/YqjD/DUF883 family [Duganella sp. CF402]